MTDKRKTTKLRNKSAKGSSTEVSRTNEGAAFEPVGYEAGNSQVDKNITGYCRLTLEEIDFLDRR